MASLKDLGNGKFEVIYSNGYDNTGKRLRKRDYIYAKTYAEAKRKAEREEVYIKDGSVSISNDTLSQMIDRWRELCKSKIAVRTSESYESVFKNYIIPYFGHKKVTAITTYEIDKFIANLKRHDTQIELSQKTKRNVFAVLSVLLTQAKKWGIIKVNPCENADKPKADCAETKPFQDEDFQIIVEAINKLDKNNLHYKIFFLIALCTGRRRGEICGLKWDDIIVRQGPVKKNGETIIKDINVFEFNKTITNKGAIKKSMKNGSKREQLEITDNLMKEIEAYRAICLSEGGSLTDKWIFSGDIEGNPINPDTISQKFKRVVINAGLNPKEYHLHCLRHTFATIGQANGADIYDISRALSHSGIGITQRVYCHSSAIPSSMPSKIMEKAIFSK